MGVVAVPRELVEEWVRPAPLTTVGEVLVVLDCSPEVAAAVVGSAGVAPDAAASVSAAASGDAVVAPYGDVLSQPLLLASAEVAFDNTISADTGRVTGCVATVRILGPNTVEVPTSHTAGVLVVSQGTVRVPVEGSAQLSFEYYGDGNYPVFPYFLPALFTDNPQNLKDAAAEVVVSGSGDAVAVGVADAALAFTGEVVLTRKGSTPIFPFFLPMVFDDLPANVNVGSARLSFVMDNASAVGVIGESVVPIEAGSPAIGSAVLPWKFPVVLLGAA